MKGANLPLPHLQILFKRFYLHDFYQLKFRIYDEGFRSQQEKKLLSGDDRAVFEVVLHGKTQGIRVASYRLQVAGYEL